MTTNGLARVVTGALHGLHGFRVLVEADLAPSLPGFSLVGLPSAALRESRERVAAALRHAGFAWPDRRITVSLAPADRRKDGAAMDLAIASALLVASGQVPRPGAGLLKTTLILGELALDGAVRPARGAVALALDAPRLGIERLLVPAAQLEELAVVGGCSRVGIRHLRELPRRLHELVAARPTGPVRPPAGPGPAAGRLHEVKGQARAKRAVVLAAAGRHPLVLSGPPGCGKSMLARRLVDLLPPLGDDQLTDLLRVYSCAGLSTENLHRRRPPLRAPHATVSVAGLVGGGRPPRPGEVTLADHGVLLLDELLEFGRDRLDLLREPLGLGKVQLARLDEAVEFPARFQLVATTNPCPCGYWGSQVRACRCPPHRARGYRQRLSGPLRDRIDLWVDMDREQAATLFTGEEEPVAGLAKLAEAHRRSVRRGVRNAELEGRALHRACALGATEQEALGRWSDQLGLSARGLVSVLRVARTVADLSGRDRVDRPALAEALAFRPGPL
jgi:magnesium chelatase family protein